MPVDDVLEIRRGIAPCLAEKIAGRHGARSLLFSVAQQRVPCVLNGKGSHRIRPTVGLQPDIRSPSSHDTNVSQAASPIALQRRDLNPVVGRDRFLPLQPKLPAVGHDVGERPVDDRRKDDRGSRSHDVRIASQRFDDAFEVRDALDAQADQSAATLTLAIRPEWLRILTAGEAADGHNVLDARIVESVFIGSHVSLKADVGGGTILTVHGDPDIALPSTGEAARISWAQDHRDADGRVVAENDDAISASRSVDA